MLIGVTYPAFSTKDILSFIIVATINYLSVVLLIWILLHTKYKIKHSTLFCVSGPFNKEIDIKSIKKIQNHNGIIVPVTWKLALNSKGLIITYNTYDDIYISPSNEEAFLKSLLEINPNILILNSENAF